jgi:hypothetical protein
MKPKFIILLSFNLGFVVWLCFQFSMQLFGNGEVFLYEYNLPVLVSETMLTFAVAVLDVFWLMRELKKLKSNSGRR